MRSILTLALLVLVFTPRTYAQEDLPINPDSVYSVLSGTSEQLLDGQAVPEGLTVAEWRADLDTLAAKMRQRMPYAEAALGGARFNRRLDSLKRVIPQQTHDRRILSVMRLLNLPAAGTGHTAALPFQRAIPWRYMPLHPYRFADGVYVMAAADSELVGREVLSIGGVPVDSVYDALAPYVSGDNKWNRERRIERFRLRYANALKAVGIVDSLDAVPIRLRTADGEIERVRVETMPLDSREFVTFFTAGRPSVPADLTWSPASVYQNSSEPTYRVSYRDSTDLLYLEFNNVWDASEDWTIAALADSLRTIADRRPLNKMVVDLRTNNGGNHYLIEPLVELLADHPKIDRRGSLYALTSWRTYSAAGSFATELEKRTKAIFAGEPGAFTPNHWGSNAPVLLPNSKVTVYLSDSYIAPGLPDEPRTHLAPDLRVPLTSDQHFENVDSTMIAVRNHEPAPRDTTTLTAEERRRFVGAYRLSPLHTVRVSSTSDGLDLQITGTALHVHFGEEGPAVFLDTALYPVSDTRLATDITDAFVQRTPGEDGLTLAWKDTTYALPLTDPDTQSPIEHIRTGRFERGAEGLRAAIKGGMKVSTTVTGGAFTSRVDELIEQDRPEEALQFGKLAVAFWPTSWLSHADLAEAYAALGRDEDALRALQPVRRLNPPKYGEMLDYLELNAAPSSGDS
jgi:hypothetical protein